MALAMLRQLAASPGYRFDNNVLHFFSCGSHSSLHHSTLRCIFVKQPFLTSALAFICISTYTALLILVGIVGFRVKIILRVS